MHPILFGRGGKSHFRPSRTHLFPLAVFRVNPMRMRLTGAALAVSIVLAGLAAPAGAALIGIYRNGMETAGQRSAPRKLSGERCGRGGSDHAFRIVVGKRTRECSYRTIVVGRDLEIASTARLLSKTPKQVRRRAFIALTLRSGETAHYQLLVYPMQRKAQLRKTLPDGSSKYLRIAKGVKTIQGTDRANKMRLRAFNITEGPEKGRCRVIAWVGKEKVAEYLDRAAGELRGRASGFAVGANRGAKGATASFDDVVVRVPNPT